MIEQALFIASGIIVIFLVFAMACTINGLNSKTPIPFVCIFSDLQCTNVYVASSALGYQLYFWSNYLNCFA